MNRRLLDIKLERLNQRLEAKGQPTLALDHYALAGGYDLHIGGTGSRRLTGQRLKAKEMGLFLDGMNLALEWTK